MTDKHKISIGVLVGLFLAVALDTAVQLCWKSAVLHVPESVSGLETIILTLRQPLFYAAIVMFFAQFFNWMQVLSKADLSFAQPITALSYVSVCSLSVLLLHEAAPPARLLGIALILVGVFFVSQTQHNTTHPQALNSTDSTDDSSILASTERSL